MKLITPNLSAARRDESIKRRDAIRAAILRAAEDQPEWPSARIRKLQSVIDLLALRTLETSDAVAIGAAVTKLVSQYPELFYSLEEIREDNESALKCSNWHSQNSTPNNTNNES